MRIDAIRIQNVASLRGEQPAIELRGALLGDAGLIAVTGPTGAGKTTLFDAVCLALFDETPRTRGRGRDPRELLARGAAEARVEIDLELDGGALWRAEWSVHRSRFAADGQLQMSRQRITDRATGSILAEGKKPVQALVEKGLGLSFEQFTSVVLIAQGQFAKFLEATDADRSALLERLTGTEIYSDLSRAAYERARAAQEKVVELEKLAGHLAGLGEEERQELEERLAAAEAELGERALALAAAEAAVRRLAELSERAAVAVEARRLLEAADAALAGAAADEERGRRAERASRLAPQLELSAEVGRRLAAAGREKESRAAAAIAAAAELEGARAALGRHFGALLARGSGAAATAAGLAGAASLEGQAIEDLKGLWRQRQRTRELLARRQQEVVQADEELAATQEDNLAAAGEQHAAEERLRPLRRAAAELDAEATELGQGRSRDDWARRRVDLQNAEDLAAQLRRLDLQALEQEEKKRRQTAEARERELGKARAALAAARAEREQQERLLALAARQADLAEHRPGLRPGEPCPICGALEHPWADRSESEDRGVLRRAEADREARIAAEKAAQAAVEAAAAEREAALLAATRASGQRDNAEQQIKNARGRWLELRLVLPELPAEPLAFSTAELPRIAALLSRFEALLPRAEAARRQVAAAEQQLQQAEKRQAVIGERLQIAEARRSAAAETLAAAAQEDDRAEAFFLGCAGELAARAGVAPPGAEKALDFVARLETHREAWQMARRENEQLAALAERVRRRRPELAASSRESGPESAGAVTVAELEQRLEAALKAEDALLEGWRLAEDRRARAATEEEDWREQAGLATRALEEALAASDFAGEEELRRALLPAAELEALYARLAELRREKERREARLHHLEQELEALRQAAAAAGAPAPPEEELEAARERQETSLAAAKGDQAETLARCIDLRARLKTEESRQEERRKLAGELAEARARHDVAARLSALIGQKDGGKFRRFAQQLNLDLLLELANLRLDRLAARYQLARAGESLDLAVIDREMAEERRPVNTLSGGESFLVSLALALALADLRRGNLRLGTLFLDEGFGSLDEDTLDTALSVLEQLQADQNTQILIISHVGALKERIDHRIDIQKLGGGRSRLQVLGPETRT